MSDAFKHNVYDTPWRSDGAEYSPAEEIRLKRACELAEAHRKTLPPQGRYRLLDVGCGVGPLRKWLPAETCELVGLEFSEAAAAVCRKNYDACLIGDVESTWPVEDGSFQAVHAGAVIEHVMDWHAPLNQANRVLAENGLLIVSTPNLRYWKEIRRLILGRQPHWLKEMAHVHGYTPKFLTTLLEVHGFAVETFEADRIRLPLLPRTSRVGAKRLARWGSVMIIAARLKRRCRVEDRARRSQFPHHKDAPLRSIEIFDARDA